MQTLGRGGTGPGPSHFTLPRALSRGHERAGLQAGPKGDSWDFPVLRMCPNQIRCQGRRGRKKKFTIKLCHCLTRKGFTWLIFPASGPIDSLTRAGNGPGWERKAKRSAALQRASGLRAGLLYSSGLESCYYARHGNKRRLLLICLQKEVYWSYILCGAAPLKCPTGSLGHSAYLPPNSCHRLQSSRAPLRELVLPVGRIKRLPLLRCFSKDSWRGWALVARGTRSALTALCRAPGP